MADHLAKVLFGIAVLGLVWVYGVVAQMHGLFPQPQLMSFYSTARQALKQLIINNTEKNLEWWYVEVDDPSWRTRIHRPEEMSQGLLLVNGIKEDSRLMARIIDYQGSVLHEWDIDWFRLQSMPDTMWYPYPDLRRL